jgi:hypothetical protein
MSWNGNARLNARRDGNERLIIDALEARGFQVTQINGKGVPDLLVSRRMPLEPDEDVRPTDTVARMWLVEIKQPKGKLNAAQQIWHERWRGPKPIVLRTVEDALKFPEVASE